MVLVLGCHKTKLPEVLSEDRVETRVSTPLASNPLTPTELAELVDNFSRVHFALDSDVLDDGARAALSANAEILWRHPEVTVEVQGHADERGTVDYNLALGQRRGAAVVQLLVAHGVAPSRLDLVSFGEERPLDAASGEVAWAENRRAEFRVLHGAATVHGTVQ